jgi:hypothetical protein
MGDALQMFADEPECTSMRVRHELLGSGDADFVSFCQFFSCSWTFF